MAQQKRFAFFLPNIFTALNMGCGFAAMVFAIKGDVYKSCMVLLLGGIFDSVDGRVARLTGTQSAFGEQFDSMSDVVSFGVAPSFLMYYNFLEPLGRVGLVGSFLFMLCGALRLARFNANIDKVSSDYFQGLPIPGAAISIIGFVLWSTIFPELKQYPYVSLGYVVFFGALMISNIPFNSFKNSSWVKRHKRATLFFIFLVMASLFLNEELMVGVVMNLYVFGSIIYFLFNKKKFGDIFDWKSGEEIEKES